MVAIFGFETQESVFFPKQYHLPRFQIGEVVGANLGSQQKRASSERRKNWRRVYGEVIAIAPDLNSKGSGVLWRYSLRALKVQARGGECRQEEYGRIFEACENQIFAPSDFAQHKFFAIPADFEPAKFTIGQQVNVVHERYDSSFYENTGRIVGASYYLPDVSPDPTIDPTAVESGWYYTLLCDDRRLDVYQIFHESEICN